MFQPTIGTSESSEDEDEYEEEVEEDEEDDEEEDDEEDDDLDVDASRRSFSSGSSASIERTDRIAIFDATNSTNKRRQWILE